MLYPPLLLLELPPLLLELLAVFEFWLPLELLFELLALFELWLPLLLLLLLFLLELPPSLLPSELLLLLLLLLWPLEFLLPLVADEL